MGDNSPIIGIFYNNRNTEEEIMIYRFYRKLKISELAAAAGGKLCGDGDIAAEGISTDSRDDMCGCVFAAIKGERFDGHDYAQGAVNNGALCVICERECCTGCAQIITDDTVGALGKIANFLMREISPLTLAVTGSVGKTTTKQLMYSLMSQKYSTHLTQGNFNNQLGLPLTIFGLRKEHNAAVLEFGMSARGEISALSVIAEPDIAVITNIGSSHLEYLGTRENIAAAKLEIRDGLKKDGKLILNGDEPLLSGIEGAVYVSAKDENAHTYVYNIRVEEAVSVFDIRINDLVLEDVVIPAVGAHTVFDAALAMTAAYYAGIDGKGLRKGVAAFENTGMRQQINTNGEGITFIRDCYNAAPESMRAAIGVMNSVAKGRRIAVLGDMRELGESSPVLHYEVGRYAADNGVDIVIAFGESAKKIAEGAKDGGCAVYGFEDISSPDEAASCLKNILRQGDTVLFKASRAVEIERIADMLDNK